MKRRQKRSAVLMVRVTPLEKRFVEAVARAEDVSVSKLVRDGLRAVMAVKEEGIVR